MHIVGFIIRECLLLKQMSLARLETFPVGVLLYINKFHYQQIALTHIHIGDYSHMFHLLFPIAIFREH